MGRPMLVPPWAADLDPTEKLIRRPIVLWSRREGLCERALLCCSPRAYLLARLLACLAVWGIRNMLCCRDMPCHVIDSLSAMIGLGLAPGAAGRRIFIPYVTTHPVSCRRSAVA